MNYLEILDESTKNAGNCACMGLDPQVKLLPKGVSVSDFFQCVFERMAKEQLTPSAFKPNIGYFASLNEPRNKSFAGYEALADVMKMLEEFFPHTPVILDSKRGDIAMSSLQYAMEAFDGWKADAVTISPYMGSDSIVPFRKNYEAKGVYILNRTSNPGGADLQNLQLASGQSLYEKVAEEIAKYANDFPGTGAVVGATGLEELKTLAGIYGKVGSIPLLIPGVGSQGGSAEDVISALKNANYKLSYVRINSSSGLTSPWKKQGIAPDNWLDECIQSIKQFLTDTKI